MLKAHPAGEPAAGGRLTAWSEAGFQRLLAAYERWLDWVLARQRLVLQVAAGTVVLTVLLYWLIPKGFFPQQDTGFVQAVTRGAPSVSFAGMSERQQALARALLGDPDVAALSSFVGVDGSNATLNTGRMLINLKPKGERSGSLAHTLDRLRSTAARVPGISLSLQPVQDLTIDATQGRAQYQFILEAAGDSLLRPWVPRLLERLQQEPALAHVSTDYLDQGLSAQVVVDRDTAARFGVTAASIDNALYDAFGQRIVSTIYTQSNQYRVILEADPAVHDTPESLQQVYLPSAGGGQLPLGSIARIEVAPKPLAIVHLGQFPAAAFSFDVASGASLEQAVAAIRNAERDVGMPGAVSTTFEGAALAFQSSLTNEVLLILAAIVTVYIVLGVLYESFIHPLTILSTLPSAGIGALLGLMVTGHELDIIAIIGIVLLIGIVKKNAIMMIDFALTAERERGLEPQQAIREAALLRFRPILMTTVAALFAALPLMLGRGTGSELRVPLGISIVGGLLVSQLLTLFTTPVVYIWFDRLAQGARRRAAAAAAAGAETGVATGAEGGA